jgi:hypothetical protein
MLLAIMAGVSAGEGGDERLIGSWSGRAASGVVVHYRFTAGEVVWDVDDPDFKREFPGGIRATYALEPGEKYLHIDMYDFQHEKLKHFTLRGILQFRDANRFRMTAPNEPTAVRPVDFDRHTVEFTRDGGRD